MSAVKVHLPTRNPSALFVRTYHLDFLPLVGESLHILPGKDQPSVNVPVLSRFWDLDGSVILDLPPHYIDPTPEQQRWLSNTKHVFTWESDRSGDLIERLLASGWTQERQG